MCTLTELAREMNRTGKIVDDWMERQRAQGRDNIFRYQAPGWTSYVNAKEALLAAAEEIEPDPKSVAFLDSHYVGATLRQ